MLEADEYHFEFLLWQQGYCADNMRGERPSVSAVWLNGAVLKWLEQT